MKLPFCMFVRLPGGTQHPVGSLYCDQEGTVSRLTTLPERVFGEYYAIHGDELDQCELVVEHPEFDLRLTEAERAAGVLQEEREQAEERTERAERDRDRYERALCALWAHPEFNRNLFRWVADTLGIEREGTK